MPVVTTLRSDPSERKKHKKRKADKADKGDKEERTKVGCCRIGSTLCDSIQIHAIPIHSASGQETLSHVMLRRTSLLMLSQPHTTTCV